MTKAGRIRAYLEVMPSNAIIDLRFLGSLGFFEAPASTKYHGAYEGGLFDHSLAVTKALVNLTEKLGLKWERPESPYIVGMYHDLCKCDSYVRDFESGKWIYNPEVIIPDHGAKSVIVASKEIRLTDEEIACIRWHMGAYETDTKMWNYYGLAIEKYPNVLYAHTAESRAGLRSEIKRPVKFGGETMTREKIIEGLNAICTKNRSCETCPIHKSHYGSAYCVNHKFERMSDVDLILYAEVVDLKDPDDPIKNNLYWERITEKANSQRSKGIKEYGRGIEDDTAPIDVRLDRIEEELIDALMYLEHLRDGINRIKEVVK